MLCVLYGDEPYKIDYYKRKATEGVDNPAVNVSSYEGEFTEEVLAVCNTFPFFSSKRVVFLDCLSLSGLKGAFEKYLKAPSATTDLVVVCDKVDKRTKVFKELDRQGVLKACDKVKDPAELEKLLLRECVSSGAKITSPAIKEFMRRINYFEVEDMTLLSAVSYLRNVSDYSNGEITEESVRECVPEFKALDIYGLSGMIRKGDMKGLMTQASLISREDAIRTASLILRDFRIAYKLSMGFTLRDVGAFKEPAFAGADRAFLSRAVSFITDEIAGVKDGTVRAESLLQEIFNRLVTV